MIEFGKTLKEAREAKGLSIADIAERTHLMSSMIADLEAEDFSRLPAPIYGRGFVKLYCETVGIDAAPMTAEFMEIYNGNREPAIRERVVPAVPESIPEPAEEPPVQMVEEVEGLEPPQGEQLDLFSEPISRPVEPKVHITPPPRVFPETSPAPAETSTDASVPAEDPAPIKDHFFSHYATPLRDRAPEITRLAPAMGRWLVVAAVAGVVVAATVVGIRALYRATSCLDKENEEPRTEAVVETRSAMPSDTKTSRTPLDVPPLYID